MFRGTRIPVAALLENLEDGISLAEFVGAAGRQPVPANCASTDICIWRGSWVSRCPGPRPRPAALAARLDLPVEEWPYLDEAVLLKTRSRKVCTTCHWFRHHAGVNCIPVPITCQLHQGLIAHGEHLVSRCEGWTDDMVRQAGWAPEVA